MLSPSHRLFVCIAIVLMLLSSCTSSEVQEEEKPMGDDGTWSIYLYLCGSNLETKMGAAGRNLSELLSVPIPDNVNIIVQTGGAKKWRSHDIPADAVCRYKVENGKLTLLEALRQTNMGSEDTLADFLTYGVETYPAEKMCVILWDHGGGSLEGVCNDENFAFDALSLSEMENALTAVSQSMTDRFEMIGFDACLMANVETASMLSPFARYMVASEEIEPSGGWDYAALVNALGGDAMNGGTFGRAICDSYMAKCQKSGKDATATLSVTDLEKMGALCGVMNTLAETMTASTTEPKGIQAIAQSADHSIKFGGTSDYEGYSNLIDLRHFAENAVDVAGAPALVEALDGAVLYRVGGSEKRAAGGLSFYYPLHYDQNELRDYTESICTIPSYVSYLKAVYENIPENPIVFLDRGSEAESGAYRIMLDESSRNYVRSVEFTIAGIGAEPEALTASWLGRGTADIVKDWETLSFYSSFRGIWLALNGCTLYVRPVESTEQYVIFTAPISLNGQKTNLRIAFIRDDAYTAGGYYKILGAWNGIDPVTGMSDKEITQLQATDRIEAYYPYQVFTFGEGYSEVKNFVQSVPAGDYVITEEPLTGESYFYQFIVTDIFGREYVSDNAWMFMTKTPEELKEHPLEVGENAAEVSFIIPMDGSIEGN